MIIGPPYQQIVPDLTPMMKLALQPLPDCPKVSLATELPLIQPGDGMVESGHEWLAKIIQAQTGSPFSHVGSFVLVKWDPSGRPVPAKLDDPDAILCVGECSAFEPPDMLSGHSNWGFSLIPIVQRLTGETSHVYHLPLKTPATEMDYQAEAQYWINMDTEAPGYGLGVLPGMAVWLFLVKLGLHPTPPAGLGRVCSTSWAEAKVKSGQVVRAGYDWRGVTPRDVAADPLFSGITEILA